MEVLIPSTAATSDGKTGSSDTVLVHTTFIRLTLCPGTSTETFYTPVQFEEISTR